MSQKHSLIKHPEYGYLHLSPIPTKEEVEHYYREEFYSSNYAQCNDSAEEKQLEDREFNHGRYDNIFATLEQQLGVLQGKSLFDIGCGYGELLLYAKELGLDVSGLEVAPEAVASLQQQGISVTLAPIEGELEKITQNKKYSVVTLLNVLEHLRDPAAVLRSIREHLLEPKGILVVDVPNEFNPLQTAANDLFALGEWWVVAPVHINYFTSESLQNLMQACGYEIVDKISSFPLELFLLMGDMYVGNANMGRACHKKRILFEQNMRKAGKSRELRAFYRAMASSGFGRQIVCFGKVDAYTMATPAKQLGSS